MEPILYRDYIITEADSMAKSWTTCNYQYIHTSYDGYEDKRIGLTKTIEEAKEEIDWLYEDGR